MDFHGEKLLEWFRMRMYFINWSYLTCFIFLEKKYAFINVKIIPLKINSMHSNAFEHWKYSWEMLFLKAEVLFKRLCWIYNTHLRTYMLYLRERWQITATHQWSSLLLLTAGFLKTCLAIEVLLQKHCLGGCYS